MLAHVVLVWLGVASLAFASTSAAPAQASYFCTDKWLIPDQSGGHFVGAAKLGAGKYQPAFNLFDDEVSSMEHAESFAGQESNSKEVAQDNLTAASNLAGAAAAMFGDPAASFGEGKNGDQALTYLRRARDHLKAATKAWPHQVTATAVSDITTYIDELSKAKKPLLPDCLRTKH